MLELKNISKNYKDSEVLSNVSFSVNKGDFISIQGLSGSGKSTLLNIIGLLDYNYKGIFQFFGKNVQDLNKKQLDHFRNKTIGFVFQFFNLFEEFSVLDNVMLPAIVEFKNLSLKRKEALKILEFLGLANKSSLKAYKLSGGEKQRVAIARSLINDPSLILADEPTGNLDFETSQNISELFKKINKEFNKSILIVTHSSELANLADKKYILNKFSKNLEIIKS